MKNYDALFSNHVEIKLSGTLKELNSRKRTTQIRELYNKLRKLVQEYGVDIETIEIFNKKIIYKVTSFKPIPSNSP